MNSYHQGYIAGLQKALELLLYFKGYNRQNKKFDEPINKIKELMSEVKKVRQLGS